MVKRIIIALIIFIALVFVISFFAAGGAKEISERKNSYTNPLAFLYDEDAPSFFDSLSSDADSESDIEENSNSFLGINLPTSPTFDFPTIDLADYLGDGSIISSDSSERSYAAVQEELLDLEKEYDDLQKQINEAKVFGTPSPHREKVLFSKFSSGTRESEPKLEYVVLSASILNKAPINITGWSIQSALTGARVFIPTGVRTFKMGGIGSISDMYVDPGKEVIVSTGISPVGTSFRENICTGYLEQFQKFEPSLSHSCPTPSDELPDTLENLQRYGVSCVEFVETLDHCEYYLGTFPDDITSQCQGFIKNALTYNGCVEGHQWRPSFSTGDWRVFLNRRFELWKNNRDIIRLLDAQGRTVDVWSY
jgi:hypothetical protein